MLVRNCSGGIVFHGDEVLLIRNEKYEWSFPKGVIRSVEKPEDVAIDRVFSETGVQATVLAPAGRTNYEFYSVTRQKPVCNKIVWYVMKTNDSNLVIDPIKDAIEGGFLPIREALDKVTYSQDKSLLMMAYQRYKELV
jgi:ADP-ribose pyrophosphatase YjhB (NUDIX family)